MDWAVEIQTTNLERRNLADLLTGLGFALIDDIQFLAFTSPEINKCDTAKAVFKKAKQLRAAFTGPAQIDPTFMLGSVIDYSVDPPRRHFFIEPQPATIRMSGGTVTMTISPPKGLSGDELERWNEERAEQEYQDKLERQRSKLEPAFRNSKAAKVLELLSIENPSGETINKIYELAAGGPKTRERKAFHEQFRVVDEQFKRFQDAVHNPTTTGDWARHAYDRPKGNNPMSKGEAIQFVRQIAFEWLEYIRTSGK